MTGNSDLTVHSTASPPEASWLKQLAASALDLLFPPYCVGCRGFGAWLCPDCVGRIETIRPPFCTHCGAPQREPATHIPAVAVRGRQECGTCRSTGTGSGPDLTRAYAFYSDPLDKAIRQFKYGDLRALAGPLGKLMADGWSRLCPLALDYDVIVPVPLHPARRRQRGFNQAELLAQAMGSRLGRPVAGRSLVRARDTVPQVDLDADARQANVQDAFQCSDRELAGKRVLLVDDVFTTGATLKAASAALRDGGVLTIWAYTLARAKGTNGPA